MACSFVKTKKFFSLVISVKSVLLAFFTYKYLVLDTRRLESQQTCLPVNSTMVFCIISWLEIQSCVLKVLQEPGENEGVVGTEVIAWEFVERGREARV